MAGSTPEEAVPGPSPAAPTSSLWSTDRGGDFGTLAPGARRTVRGRLVIEAGSPGLERNLALATAVNANLARDAADTRVLAQRRIIPPVTG